VSYFDKPLLRTAEPTTISAVPTRTADTLSLTWTVGTRTDGSVAAKATAPETLATNIDDRNFKPTNVLLAERPRRARQLPARAATCGGWRDGFTVVMDEHSSESKLSATSLTPHHLKKH
jgi:hypothetical protein